MKTKLSNKKIQCIHCREMFALSKDEVEMYEDGNCDPTPICDECLEMINDIENFNIEDCFSDADPGL